MTGRSPGQEQRLDAAWTAYEAALLRQDRYEVASTRIQLIRLLVATGWRAPQEVLEQVARDQKALRRQIEVQAEAAEGLVRPPTHRQPPKPAGPDRQPDRRRPRSL